MEFLFEISTHKDIENRVNTTVYKGQTGGNRYSNKSYVEKMLIFITIICRQLQKGEDMVGKPADKEGDDNS